MANNEDKKVHPLRVSMEIADALKSLAEEKGLSLREAAEQTIQAGLMAQALGQAVPSAQRGESILSLSALESLEQWAKAHSVTPTEAGDRLIEVGINRLGALELYAQKQQAKKGSSA